VGRNKGSLTEQQTKGTVTTTIQMIHNTNRTTQRAVLPDQTGARTSSSAPLEPSMMAHGMEYPALSGQVGSDRLTVPLPGFW